MNSKSTLKLGIIGLGRIGKVHLQNVMQRIPEAEVLAASDPIESTHEFAKKLGVKEVFSEAEAITSHPEIDAVIICSPNSTHSACIKSAASTGKHIFCEKPLEMTVSAIEEIIAVTELHNVKLQVGFNRRFDANFSRVHQQVKSGKIGEPHILKITSRDPAPPPIEYIKTSGGLFMDMTVHDFDIARFIVGSEIVEVYAVGAVRVDEAIGEAGDIDTAIISIKFENGCMGVIDTSRQAVYGYDQRVEIFGSKGMSRIDNNFADQQYLYDTNGVHKGLPLNFFMERYTEAYCNEMNSFIKAVKENSPVHVDGLDALTATKLALSAKESLLSNKPISV